jgi:hypothetical protein
MAAAIAVGLFMLLAFLGMASEMRSYSGKRFFQGEQGASGSEQKAGQGSGF